MAKATSPTKATEGPQDALRIAARVNGFRRCGRAWPASGVTVPKSEFSTDEIEILLSDPELVVIEMAE